jgi:hypothetical protein
MQIRPNEYELSGFLSRLAVFADFWSRQAQKIRFSEGLG